MPRKVIAYDDGDFSLEITVHLATVAQGLERVSLLAKARGGFGDTEDSELGLEDISVRLLKMWTVPALIAATTKIENKEGGTQKLKQPLSEKKIMNLPEPLVTQWSDAVFELNPHWAPGGVGQGGFPGPSAEKLLTSSLGLGSNEVTE